MFKEEKFIYKYIPHYINLYKISNEVSKMPEKELKLIHYPTLKTVLMVEEALKNAQLTMTREQLKKKLPKKVMHQTLNIVLDYLERSGKIMDGRKGLLWIYNPSPKLKKAIKEGIEV